MSTLRKAESSIEFMSFMGILLVFFVFFVGIIGMSNSDIGESTVYTSANNILNTVVNEINTASRIDGYHREFFIPESLSDGEAYNITCNTNLRMVKIEWDQGRNIIENIETENVNGNVSAGYNRIENVNGEVNISAS
jgi:hypothetical protein